MPLPAARPLAALSLLALAAGVGGCQNRLHDENLALYEENRALRDQMSTGGGAGEIDTAQLDALQAELNESQQLIGTLQNELDAAEMNMVRQPAPENLPQIEGADTTFNAATGEVTVAVAGDVLFGAGRSDLRDSAKATLDQVADALQNDFAGDAVRVEGHTDTDPVTKTKGTYTDNFGLSSARALTVMRYLVGQGVDPARVQAVAKGEFDPRAQDKAQNRRVEIVVLTR